MLNAAVIVAALGYFVDVYDLILFSVVRVASLKDIGITDPTALLDTGVLLLNSQMIGMLTGGVLWGIWGDKKGRLSVLFGSILMYSVANIGNGFVHSVTLYSLLRFFAGVGLAGELGAGITLVSEILPKEKRGLGTTIVATVGVMGALVAAAVAESFHWRTSYFVGGGLGLLLLFLRVSVRESGMFAAAQKKSAHKGELRMLFNSRERLRRYLNCIFSGLPIWFVLGIFVTFAPEFGKAFRIVDPVSAGKAVFYVYVGFVFGDLTSGLLSQWLKSRKKAILTFLILTTLSSAVYVTALYDSTAQMLYWICIPLGVGAGYWAVLVTSSAEQFGTNLRSTVTTSVPNFVRGAAVPMTFFFKTFKDSAGVVGSSLIVGGISLVIAFFALSNLKETFSNDLDYVEDDSL